MDTDIGQNLKQAFLGKQRLQMERSYALRSNIHNFWALTCHITLEVVYFFKKKFYLFCQLKQYFFVSNELKIRPLSILKKCPNFQFSSEFFKIISLFEQHGYKSVHSLVSECPLPFTSANFPTHLQPHPSTLSVTGTGTASLLLSLSWEFSRQFVL